MTTLFVYGTLTNPTKVRIVLGHSLEAKPATLYGYEKHGLDILISPSGQVEGFILEVSDEDMKKLDRYEGVAQDVYMLIPVEVECEDKHIPAVAYTLIDKMY